MNMNEPDLELESMLESLYDAETTDDFSDRVMQRITTESDVIPSVDRSPVRQRKFAIGLAAACAAILIGGVFQSRSKPHEESGIAQSTSDAASQSASLMHSETQKLPPIPSILEFPSSGREARQIAKSDRLKDNFVLFIGTLDNPKEKGDQQTVELKVDHIIKGDAGDGPILARDELFSCQGAYKASESFPLGKPLLCWLTLQKEKWQLAELEQLTPELEKLLDAVTGDNQAESLRLMITPHGLDFKTTEMIKLLASPEQVTPLLKELIRESPVLLEPYQDAPGPSWDVDWQKRLSLFSYRLSPAIDILSRFSQHKDTELIDLILPCYPMLQDPGGDGFRFYLSYYLKGICCAVQYDDSLSLSDKQVAAVRELMLTEVEGGRDRKASAVTTAYSVLGCLSDTETIDALLKKQSERPVHDLHETIAGALFSIAYGMSASETDDRRICESWIQTLESFDDPAATFENEAAEKLAKSFANKVAGCLYQSDISVSDLRELRAQHRQTQVPWLGEAVARFARKNFPVPLDANPDADTKPSFSENDTTLKVEFSNDAFADDATMKRLEEWDGPITVRLNRSSRVLEILAALDELEFDRLELAYLTLSHDVFVQIGNLRSLRSVSIYRGESNEPSTPAEFREFYKLRKLESLDVMATRVVNDDGWEAITAIGHYPVLRQLSLRSVGPVSDWHLGRLQRLKTLEDIRIDSRDVTSDGIVKLAAALPKLKTILLPRVLIRTSLIDQLQRRNIQVYPRTIDRSTRVWRTEDGR